MPSIGTSSLFTTTYNSKANGQVERFNRTVLAALRTFIGEHPSEWDRYAPLVAYSYNTTVQSSTGLVPFELVVSNPPNPSFMDLPPPHRDENAPRFYTEWFQRLEQVVGQAKACQARSQSRYKRNYDKKSRPIGGDERITIGSFAFMRREPTQKVGKSKIHKLTPVVFGPFEITDLDDSTAVLRYPDGQVERVSRDRLIAAPKSCWPYTPQVTDRVKPSRCTNEQYGIVKKILDFGIDEVDGRPKYQVLWTDGDLTWSDIADLPANLLNRFHKRTKTRVPAEIGEAFQG